MGDMKGSSGFTFGLETGLTINKQQPRIKKKLITQYNLKFNHFSFFSPSVISSVRPIMSFSNFSKKKYLNKAKNVSYQFSLYEPFSPLLSPLSLDLTPSLKRSTTVTRSSNEQLYLCCTCAGHFIPLRASLIFPSFTREEAFLLYSLKICGFLKPASRALSMSATTSWTNEEKKQDNMFTKKTLMKMK